MRSATGLTRLAALPGVMLGPFFCQRRTRAGTLSNRVNAIDLVQNLTLELTAANLKAAYPSFKNRVAYHPLE
jgi:hypothetical protein